MHRLILLLLLTASSAAKAQHCPWDCSGMILMKTAIAKEQLYKLHPVFVDENKNIIVDTIYGTGLDTYDTCNFLSYKDFTAYRTSKVSLHHWYSHDTVYHFADGFYIVKVNYCKYKNTKLFLRFTDPKTRNPEYHYLEIKPSNLFHLHDFSSGINQREYDKVKSAVLPKVFIVSEKDWKL